MRYFLFVYNCKKPSGGPLDIVAKSDDLNEILKIINKVIEKSDSNISIQILDAKEGSWTDLVRLEDLKDFAWISLDMPAPLLSSNFTYLIHTFVEGLKTQSNSINR